jgi:hypothetical protein
MTTCRSCSEARRASKASVSAIARGDVRTAAAQAKEAAGHIADKARAESERVRKLLRR